MKEKKVLISVIIGIFLMTILLGGYWTFKKENLTITVKGDVIKISTFKNTVKEILDEQNITYDEDDEINYQLDEKLVDNMNIKVTEVKKTTQTEYEKIDFEVNLIEDKSLIKGSNKIEQEGKEGEKELIYELIYKDGVLESKNLIKESVTKEPISKIVKKGIKEDMLVASRGMNSRHMNVEATAYAGDGITSTGTVPKWGTIAVDPKVIPYGTKVYIPQFEMIFTAEDCGGAIKGNKIDIFMNSEKQAYTWGRRKIDIYIVK